MHPYHGSYSNGDDGQGARQFLWTPRSLIGYEKENWHFTLLGGTLSWYPRPDLAGGYPARGVPYWVTPLQGTPPPIMTWQCTPHSWTWLGTPPRCLPHGILGNVAKHYGIWVPPLWTDRLMDGWTDTCQNITFPSYYVRVAVTILKSHHGGLSGNITSVRNNPAVKEM